MSSFGKRLLSFRKHTLKLTRKQFSETFKISAVTLRSWENGNIKISERNSIGLEKKLLELGTTPDDLYWLFIEDELSPSNDVTQKELSYTALPEEETPTLTQFVIKSFLYEPLLPKGTALSLQEMSLENIKCPCLGAIKDREQNMHFGLINQTINGKFCMHAYQGKPYIVFIDKTFDVYIINNVKIH